MRACVCCQENTLDTLESDVCSRSLIESNPPQHREPPEAILSIIEQSSGGLHPHIDDDRISSADM